MKKILFPTDFSAPSANAFRYALLLADHIGASIKVIHATFPIGDIESYGSNYSYSVDQLLTGLKEEADVFVKTGLTQVLEQLHNTPVVTSDAVLGTPVTSIVEMAKKEDVDMILMGSRGKNKSGIDKMIGSFAAGVVERATRPVVVIPESAAYRPLNKIAYATSLSDADPFEIWKTVKLLSPLASKIDVIHVHQVKENSEKVEERIKDMKLFFEEHYASLDIDFHTISGLDLQKGLDQFTAKYQPDMMVMCQAHHGFWDKLFFKSNTKERATLTQIPLLVQKPST